MAQGEVKRSISELGEYTILARLGEGGMGAVYKARHKSTENIVALKVLFPHLTRKNEQYLDRFRREAEVASKLNHPNIVKSLDYGEDKGYHYLAMEYIEGESVAEVIKKNGRIDEKKAIEIVKQIASALVEIAKANIVHRDIKPANILISRNGNAKLADLGMVKLTDSSMTLTATNMAVGTPFYMSPEQVKGEKNIDIRSDIYSLGATLYHMLTGHVPFGGATIAEVMYKQLEGKLPHPKEEIPELSEGICEIVERMMAKIPQDRYKAVENLIGDLNAVGQGKEPTSAQLPRVQSVIRSRIRTRGMTRREQPARQKSNNVLLPLGIAGGVLLLVVAIAILGQSPKNPKTDKDSVNKNNTNDVILKTDYENEATKVFNSAMENIKNKAWVQAQGELNSLNILYRHTSFVKAKANEIEKESRRCEVMISAESDAKAKFDLAKNEFKREQYPSAKRLCVDLMESESLKETLCVNQNIGEIKKLREDAEKKIAEKTVSEEDNQVKEIIDRAEEFARQKEWKEAMETYKSLAPKFVNSTYYKNNESDITQRLSFFAHMRLAENQAATNFRDANEELEKKNYDNAMKIYHSLLGDTPLKETKFVIDKREDIEKGLLACKAGKEPRYDAEEEAKRIGESLTLFLKQKSWEKARDALIMLKDKFNQTAFYKQLNEKSIINGIEHYKHLIELEKKANKLFEDAKVHFKNNEPQKARYILEQLRTFSLLKTKFYEVHGKDFSIMLEECDRLLKTSNAMDPKNWVMASGKLDPKDNQLTFGPRFTAYYNDNEFSKGGLADYEIVMTGTLTSTKLLVGILYKKEDPKFSYNCINLKLDSTGQFSITLRVDKNFEPYLLAGAQVDQKNHNFTSDKCGSLLINSDGAITLTEIKFNKLSADWRLAKLYDGTNDKDWKPGIGTTITQKGNKLIPASKSIYWSIYHEWPKDFPTTNYKIKISGWLEAGGSFAAFLPKGSGMKRCDFTPTTTDSYFDIILTVSDSAITADEKTKISISDLNYQKLFLLSASVQFKIKFEKITLVTE